MLSATSLRSSYMTLVLFLKEVCLFNKEKDLIEQLSPMTIPE
jgi:hypothetical protein